MQQYSMLPELLIVADSLPQVVKQDAKPSLQEEFMDYCTFRLPDSAKTQTVVDKYCHSVSEIKDLSRQCLFSNFNEVGESCHYNSHGNTERLFSHIGVNKTKHQNSPSLEILCSPYSLTRKALATNLSQVMT